MPDSPSSATIDQLRCAARIIYTAATGTTAGNPIDIATAHNTLVQHRHHTRGTIRDAIDTYLDDDTWHHGPFNLHAAIHQLADALDVTPDDDSIIEQLHLF